MMERLRGAAGIYDVLTALLAFLIVLGCASCAEDPPEGVTQSVAATKVDEAIWPSLESRRIFFGHQSVGADILAGIELHQTGISTRLEVHCIVSTDSASTPGIYETPIGRNGDPRGKIDSFGGWLDSPVGGDFDIAMMKLCYIDFDHDSKVAELFEHYRSTIARIQNEATSTTIVHCTVPLEGPPSGVWSFAREVAKKLLGSNRTTVLNERRESFNDLMRQTYAGREPLFDLALIESTGEDGRSATQTLNGRSIPRLASEYTDDGSHLNQTGQRVVAGELLRFLAEIPMN